MASGIGRICGAGRRMAPPWSAPGRTQPWRYRRRSRCRRPERQCPAECNGLLEQI